MSPHHEDKNAVPPVRDFVAARSLKRQLFAELRTSWDEALSITPEDMLSWLPANPEADPDIASLPSEADRQRRRQDQQPTCEEYARLFPDQNDSCAGLVERQALMPPRGGTVARDSRLSALPAIGDELFGFRLCHELGRGSYARVFLAEQKKLAARPVVVKVSAIDGNEPQTLAQLQHTHIVPIYSVDEDAQAGLRVVCMPYFGGASLSRVLQALGAEASLPSYGKQLIAALSAVRSPWAVSAEAGQTGERGPLSVLAGLSYVDAAVWIIARLAEALQHAHQRGVLHRDVKPSNILLSGDGQPMLLDFNLAENAQDDHALTAVGGTVAYMAPEHLRALASRDPALARQVDQRADIYGLGMVFYELLTGRNPFKQNTGYGPLPTFIEAMAVERDRFAPSLRQHRPDAPWSLESIIRKCLDPDPVKRYQQAEHLAEDLRRHLEDRPLKHAPELSWRERLTKWRRRHPRLAANGLITAAAAVLLAVGSPILFHGFAQWKAVQERAHEGDRAVAQQTRQSFLIHAQRARCFLNTTLGEYAPLQEGLEACEKALGHYHVLEREDWQKQVVWQRLDQVEQRQLAEDIRELLLLLARAAITEAARRVDPELTSALAPALAPVGAAALPVNCLVSAQGITVALENGLTLLDRAYTLGDPQTARAIWEDRAIYLDLLRRSDEARAARQEARAKPPITARDHYLLGSSFARNGRYAEAINELKEALRLNRRDYWSRFHLGMCYRQQGEYVQAANEFRACTVLWPDFSWGYFNLGEVLHHLGKKWEAIEEYSAALAPECHPKIVQAYFNRGLVYLDLAAWHLALDDFDKASAGGCREVVLHGGRGIALAQLGRDLEANAAFTQAWATGRNNLEMLLSYAFMISQRRPDEAREIFLNVLERDPDNSRAMYGCGMLLEHQRRDSEDAVAWFSRALKRRPTFVEARLARAIVRAHQGRWEPACQEIDLCVGLEPTGQILYGAACFYALRSAASQGSRAMAWAEVALELLGEALKKGYGHSQAVEDSDLDGIRQYPKFHWLLEQARKPKDSR